MRNLISKCYMCSLTADEVETAEDLESEVEPEDGTALWKSRDQTSVHEELFLMGEQRKWFLSFLFLSPPPPPPPSPPSPQSSPSSLYRK